MSAPSFGWSTRSSPLGSSTLWLTSSSATRGRHARGCPHQPSGDSPHRRPRARDSDRRPRPPLRGLRRHDRRRLVPCVGGMHALAFEGDELVGHGSVVQRRLLHGGRTLRTGYLEGVAVRADHRRRGHGGAIMAELERVARGAYELGALAGTDEAAAFYAARGWLPWRGPTFAMTPEGVVRTDGEDDSVYVCPLDAPLDPAGPLTCDWREGE